MSVLTIGVSPAEYPQGLTSKMTPLTSETEPRAITNSAEVAFGGAFQYEPTEPESKGVSNDKTGAESTAVSTYNYTKLATYYELQSQQNGRFLQVRWHNYLNNIR